MYKIETLPNDEEEAIAAAVAAALAEAGQSGAVGGNGDSTAVDSKTQEQIEEEIARFAAMNAGGEDTAEFGEDSQLAGDSLVTGTE